MRSSRLVGNLNGIFPLMKPHGITSAQLLNRLKERLLDGSQGSKKSPTLKMGHGGTLDSTATGVLVAGIGNECKKLKCFLDSDKVYLVRSQLGVATDTYNDIGQVTMEKLYEHVTADILQERLRQFEGRIKQVPPIYSALKKHGRRYSDWAREGVEIEIKPRIVHCYELKLTEFEPPYFSVSVTCGPGFYIRSLIHDLGQAVGSCAHVQDLQRTKQGPFHINDALCEDQWTAEHIKMSISKWKHKLNRYFNNYEFKVQHDKW